jgi:hypothetical protein
LPSETTLLPYFRIEELIATDFIETDKTQSCLPKQDQETVRHNKKQKKKLKQSATPDHETKNWRYRLLSEQETSGHYSNHLSSC